MDTVLALTWRITPGDFARFEALYPLLRDLYAGISIYAPPGCDPALVAAVAGYDRVKLSVSGQRVDNRRWRAIQQALDFDAAYVHLCDGDHALVRMMRDLDDWRQTLAALRQTDCLIVGRSPEVLASYPAALRETERMINLVGSYLLGQPVDLGSGARGFSRRAVEYLVAHASPQTHPVATDAEFPVLLHRAGFKVTTFESSGAIYELQGDAHRDQLDSADQWAKRVELARVIIEAGIDAAGG